MGKKKIELSEETKRAVEEGNKIREELLGGADPKKSHKDAPAASKKSSKSKEEVLAKLKEDRSEAQEK